MTIHQALWFIDQVNRFHPENRQRPSHRFTRQCLYKNVHPNQQAFVTSEGALSSEGAFAS